MAASGAPAATPKDRACSVTTAAWAGLAVLAAAPGLLASMETAVPVARAVLAASVAIVRLRPVVVEPAAMAALVVPRAPVRVSRVQLVTAGTPVRAVPAVQA